jgi:IS5 family transposase
VTPGEAYEVSGYDALIQLHDVDPDKLLGDKGYDSDEIRDDLNERGIEAVILPRSNRRTVIEYDRLQAAQCDRTVRQPSQAIPSHRHPVREDRKSLSFKCYVSRQQCSG